MFDPIDKNNDLVYLVDLIQKLNSNLHKWSALHMLIQAAIIVAVAIFMGWDLKEDTYLRTGIISGLCVFAIIISCWYYITLFEADNILNIIFRWQRELSSMILAFVKKKAMYRPAIS